MLEAVHTDLVFTISLKRSTQNLQLSTNSPADYPIFGPMLLKKSFWRYEQIFTEALVRRSENDVGGHMISPISNRQLS